MQLTDSNIHSYNVTDIVKHGGSFEYDGDAKVLAEWVLQQLKNVEESHPALEAFIATA